jgi:regulator of replication initiation timing
VVREEVDHLRDDMEEAIHNLHMDMIGQFHLQSQEISSTLSMQLATIQSLTEENHRLREENEHLREHSKSHMQ